MPFCGDAVLEMGEDCDDGNNSDNIPDACCNSCVIAMCGDGPAETCDDGAANSDTDPGACTAMALGLVTLRRRR